MIKIAVIQVMLMLAICLPRAAAESERPARRMPRVAVVMDKQRPEYDLSLEGFNDFCKAKTKTFFTAEMPEAEVRRMIEYYGADLLVPMGSPALKAVRVLENRPVVHLHVLHPREIIGEGRKNFFGVRMFFSPGKEFEVLHTALKGKVKRIGLVYGARSEYMVESIRRFAGKEGVRIIARDRRSKNHHYFLMRDIFNQEIDAFWLLPDPSVNTMNFIADLFIYSILEGVPIYSSFRQHALKGATISLHGDYYDMGAQAGAMAATLLSGGVVAGGPPVDPRKERITINTEITGKLGIEIDKTILEKAEKTR